MVLYQKIIIGLLLILGFMVRIYKIDNPVADWHSHRQADTASVTKNMVTNSNFFLPTYHDLSNIQTGQDNPQGLRLVELPIYNYISAKLYLLTKNFYPKINIDVTSRLVSILFTIASAYLIFLISHQTTKKFIPSLLPLLLFLFLPFSIYYSRSILPEPTAIFFMIISLYTFPKNLYISAIFLALGILVKPYIALILLPTLIFYTFDKKINYYKLIIFTVISLIPFTIWRWWISQFPQGIPASNWLFNGGDMRFRPVWFRWLFFERIGKLILGIYGVIPFILGFAYIKNKSIQLCLSFLIGILIYFSVIARGNIQHDYYQFLIIPQISIITGFGFYYLSKSIFKYRLVGIFLSIIIFSFMMSYSWYEIKNYFNINNHSKINAGQKANEILPLNSLVIAPNNGDTSFLYQTKRNGWPIEIYDLENIKNQHPNNPIYLVSTDFNQYTNKLLNSQKVLYQSTDFIILDIINNYETKK